MLPRQKRWILSVGGAIFIGKNSSWRNNRIEKKTMKAMSADYPFDLLFPRMEVVLSSFNVTCCVNVLKAFFELNVDDYAASRITVLFTVLLELLSEPMKKDQEALIPY